MRFAFLPKILFFISLFLFQTSYSQKKIKTPERYPEFSWKTVPVAFHFGKKGGMMTKKERKFVTSHSKFIVLEKAHGRPFIKDSEIAIRKEAKRIKKICPQAKVIFYWNAFLDYPLYKAHREFNKHPNWWLRTKTGKLDLKLDKFKRYDLTNPEFRDWWTNIAKAETAGDNSDGVFMDAFNQVITPVNKRKWGIDKYNEMQVGLKNLVAETRKKIGDDKLIVYNGIRSIQGRNVGNGFPEHTDAVMIEHFGMFRSTSKESMLTDIQEMEKAGKSGKIVAFKAWPNHTFLDKDFMKKSLKKKRAISKQNLLFPLASFLVGAQENSYLIYNWGYYLSEGSLEWYPEFDKPLGKPLNEMQVNGWVLTRKYKYADVWVDLETRKAKIDWKK